MRTKEDRTREDAARLGIDIPPLPNFKEAPIDRVCDFCAKAALCYDASGHRVCSVDAHIGEDPAPITEPHYFPEPERYVFINGCFIDAISEADVAATCAALVLQDLSITAASYPTDSLILTWHPEEARYHASHPAGHHWILIPPRENRDAWKVEIPTNASPQ